MRKNIKILSSALLATLVALTSCTDEFAKINAPQDAASSDIMNGDNFKSGAFYLKLQSGVVPDGTGSYQHCENLTGDVWGRYMMSNVKWKGQNFSEFSYQHVGWINNPFNQLAQFYPSWKEIVENTKGTGVNYAWAQVLRVATMQRLTDLYGPLPYSKVEGKDLYVPYDSQEVLYKTMLQELTEAAETLKSYAEQNPNATPMKDFDRVYGGDYSKWALFANSLKLRMAMRIRLVEPALAQQMAEEAVSGGVIETNNDNAAYQPAGRNSFWTIAQSWGDCRACADITSYMDGFKDPRQSKYFDKSAFTGIDYAGLRSATDANDDQYKKYSKVRVSETDKFIWMTAAEVAFLKAEGALCGWNMGGQTDDAGAKKFYEDGIKLSFEQWGVGDASSYITDAISKQADYVDPNGGKENMAHLSDITIKWESSVDNDRKLERIITQKWIAMWPLGQEAWSDYRRTGYPQFFPLVRRPSENKYSTYKVANRLLFATTEYTENAENINAAVGLLGGPDDFITPMWWQKK